MNLFRDPNLFSYVIMVLYVLNAGWQLRCGRPGYFVYWLCACGITASVTFMMGNK